MASKRNNDLNTDFAPEEFSLEDILAEYGGSRGQRLMEDVERTAVPPDTDAEPPLPRRAKQAHAAPKREQQDQGGSKRAQQAPSAAQSAPQTSPAAKSSPKAQSAAKRAPQSPPPTPREEARDRLIAQAVDLEKLERELPLPPRPVSLEEVVDSTVTAVMEEREPLLKPRRTLFSRRPLEDTEQLYGPPEPEPEPVSEPIGPEMELSEAAAKARDGFRSRSGGLLPAAFLALIPTALLAAGEYGLAIPYWTGEVNNQAAILLACLVLSAFFCRGVFVRAAKRLAEKRCTGELLISLAALAAMGDCVMRIAAPDRTDVMPYAAVSCMALFFAQWGDSRADRGMYDTFRAAAMDDDPPYLVTDTLRGACKQRGAVTGFYTTAMRSDGATVAQTVFLPLIGMGALVFSGMTTLGRGAGANFLLHLSILLSAAGTFCLPLCWGLPWSRLTRHLQKAGCAAAGWNGAERISRRRTMIVTDSDLFPPGAVQLNGMKIYGEERKKVVSFAASIVRAADCGLVRLFDGLLRSELGQYLKVDDFAFYEEGGWSGTIRGESVLMGTASFMRKMDVRLPGDINLKTGMFLAADRQLIAVFAVKYNPSENVDFALKMMRRNRITAILASRDPNVNPALLKRKFGKRVKVDYPDLTARVALSEAGKDRDLPRALLFREGLLPYAETVVGSRRLVRAVRTSSAVSILGSAVGLLLTAYLAALGSYDLMAPLALEAFLLLWTLPVLLIGDLAGRY